MSKGKATREWFFSPLVLESLSGKMRTAAKRLEKASRPDDPGAVVAQATEVLAPGKLPAWSERLDTRYFVLIDIPAQAIILLPSKLNLRRPEQRLYASADPQSLRRLIVAQFRDRPSEGIVDAFLLPDCLEVFSGNLQRRRFRLEEVPALAGLDRRALADFSIDRDGSFLHWETADIHLGLSELLMATDRDYRVEREIERAQRDHAAEALARMRSTRGLRQSDIPGLSERHVRRLEKGESHLTADAADKLARAFRLSTESFLEELSELSSRVASSKESRSPKRESGKRHVA